MMFRSLFFIAPLVASEEQTAMLQLNRRGEVSQHSVSDALVGSLEHSLMSKDAEKPSEHAMCTYFLKTVHAPSLMQKISELKGQEKTQLLLQRAMDSVGEQNLRSLEENLMSKDDEKKEEEKKEEEQLLTPCQVLHVFRNTFKDHMHNEREVANKIKETGHKVGDIVEKVVKESLHEAVKVLKEGKPLAEAEKKLKILNLTNDFKEIQDHRKDEVTKSLEAIEKAIKQLKGATHKKTVDGKLESVKIATTFNTSKDTLKTSVEAYEHAAITILNEDIKLMMTNMTLPLAPGYTQADVDKVFGDIKANMATDEGKATEALNVGIGYVRTYIDHIFEKQANNTWNAFETFWSSPSVLGTDAEVKMTVPPKDINDDLFWQQASYYLDYEQTLIEKPCHSTSFDMKKAGEFAPRKICDGAELKCEDEFLFLSKKAGKVPKDECEKVEKADIPNDTKVDEKKITDEFDFMKKADGKTCEKWEKIKDACKSIKKM